LYKNELLWKQLKDAIIAGHCGLPFNDVQMKNVATLVS
jgi:hypothetical protein